MLRSHRAQEKGFSRAEMSGAEMESESIQRLGIGSLCRRTYRNGLLLRNAGYSGRRGGVQRVLERETRPAARAIAFYPDDLLTNILIGPRV